MKITKIGEKLGNIGKSREEKVRFLNISEAHTLWETLTAKYYALNITSVLLNVAKDQDLKLILNEGIEAINQQINIIEKIMNDYSVPLPERPPKSSNTAYDINTFSDKFIYQTIHNGMQSHNKLLMDHFNHSVSSTLREAYRKAMTIEMDLYDAFVEYGKMKGYLMQTPTFRP